MLVSRFVFQTEYRFGPDLQESSFHSIRVGRFGGEPPESEFMILK
jgi:hypothetical protein